jgi:excisionase family DNA binding protein
MMTHDTGTDDQLIRVSEAGAMLALSEKTIRRYISAGTLTRVRVGPRAVRVRRGEVEALIRSTSTPA